MAIVIPPLNDHTVRRMTQGEKRFAQRLKKFLEDDYLVWYDIPVGKERRYPDFIILHPHRGLLFLEVKDWDIKNIQSMTKTQVELHTFEGLKSISNPLHQARQYMNTVVNTLVKDAYLQQKEEPHKGKFIAPYGSGVVLPFISRKQFRQAIPDLEREALLPDHLVICSDEMTEKMEPEIFQEKLWGMFQYDFNQKLSVPEIDRIRWHLFPECRIDHHSIDSDDTESPIETVVPEIIRIMDVQQEVLAKNLGDGHRVIHGVAGSGKTMILGYRCLHLASTLEKPILVLCYNVALAAKLRSLLVGKVGALQVSIVNFHAWCNEQARTYQVDVSGGGKYYENLVDSIIYGVDHGMVPREQYGAILIDEGHDFQPEWLKLISQMVDKESDSLLLLYDDAQSIYKKKTKLGFSLASVGIQAKGRTTILKLNYRNTQEILSYAYQFAQDYMKPSQSNEEEDVPLIEPEGAGAHGPYPYFNTFKDLEAEIDFTLKCLKKWSQQDIQWRSTAILCFSKKNMTKVKAALDVHDIPNTCLLEQKDKKNYDATLNKVTITTVQSSKGLEFPRVIIIGLGKVMESSEEDKQHNARLLYVGMTRAQEKLVLTSDSMNDISRKLSSLSERYE